MIEHIVEEKDWADQLQALLSPFDVFWVGVHAPVAEIERREGLRGNRQQGEGLYHPKTHQFCTYNVEIDTTKPVSENVTTIINGWKSRPKHFFVERVVLRTRNTLDQPLSTNERFGSLRG